MRESGALVASFGCCICCSLISGLILPVEFHSRVSSSLDYYRVLYIGLPLLTVILEEDSVAPEFSSSITIWEEPYGSFCTVPACLQDQFRIVSL